MSVMTLTEFVTARLGEVEGRAWAVHDVEKCDALLYEEDMADAARRDPACNCGMPARALREVEAKRKILDHHKPVRHEGRTVCHSCLGASTFWPCRTLQHLAAIDSDHPDYDPAWG
jgi:hypothetical protein